MIKKISALGQNIQFVAFFAHAGVSYFIIDVASDSCKMPLALLIIVLAGIKEFYFDARFEKDPPQTFWDNLEDWLGWSLGVILGFHLWELLL